MQTTERKSRQPPKRKRCKCQGVIFLLVTIATLYPLWQRYGDYT